VKNDNGVGCTMGGYSRKDENEILLKTGKSTGETATFEIHKLLIATLMDPNAA